MKELVTFFPSTGVTYASTFGDWDAEGPPPLLSPDVPTSSSGSTLSSAIDAEAEKEEEKGSKRGKRVSDEMKKMFVETRRRRKQRGLPSGPNETLDYFRECLPGVFPKTLVGEKAV